MSSFLRKTEKEKTPLGVEQTEKVMEETPPCPELQDGAGMMSHCCLLQSKTNLIQLNYHNFHKDFIFE